MITLEEQNVIHFLMQKIKAHCAVLNSDFIKIALAVNKLYETWNWYIVF